ncbi:MAG: hypothetical protein U0X76_06935 [Bacteroidia bacterium]
MYSFGGSLYEIVAYIPAGTYGYKFTTVTSGASESVPSTCSVNGSRSIDVSKDTLQHAFVSDHTDCVQSVSMRVKLRLVTLFIGSCFLIFWPRI